MDYDEYLDSPIFWLRRAYLGVRKTLDAELIDHLTDLTGAQFEVLRQLWHRDGLSQRELEQQLAVRSATLTRLLDGLCARGLVERRRNVDDGRVKDVFLTPMGHALCGEAGKVIARVQARLLQGFSTAEVERLKDGLKRMATNLDEAGDRA